MTQAERQAICQLSRETLESLQFTKLMALWDGELKSNSFYQGMFASKFSCPQSIQGFRELPFTSKPQLIRKDGDQRAANLTFALDDYARFHRTSGTQGHPLVVLDTPADWDWWIETWQYVLDAAKVTSADRAVMAFSFGPFIGFWSAYDAAIARGLLVAPSGGLSTEARLDMISRLDATVVFCTPSYALRMAEVADQQGIEIASMKVDKIIVAGEPGGSIKSIRSKIESSWNATVVDHSGASEIGPWGFDAGEGRGLFVNEAEFIAEVISLEDQQPVPDGAVGELVLTSLGRAGCPVIRYRTGDLVKPVWEHDLECNFVLLEGGVLGRVDDMMIVRGVNIYPSSIEAILREFPDVDEYRMTTRKAGALDELEIEVECPANRIKTIQHELYQRLGLRVEVKRANQGSLPRFEAKGKRFIDERDKS